MTVFEKPSVLEFDTLLGGHTTGLALAIAENPMLLDRLVILLTDVRTAAAERAKTRFRLTKSYWPNFETEQPTDAFVTWIARDVRHHRDVEVVYDFSRKEYSIRNREGLPDESEVNDVLAMIYAVLPERELKMIAIMQQRYETMSPRPEIKRAAGKRR